MEYTYLNFFTLLGGVGMFLYGMKVMSEGLQKIAGDRLRNILSVMTKNRFMGVLTGILITALIQSSSASTVMVVSFVNAGLMSLAQSMAVIMGANIGTTFTAWIIAIFGFKVNIYALAVPLLALAVPMMFSSKSSWKSMAEFLIGFAFLFMGLDYIGQNVPDLKANPGLFAFLQSYSAMTYGNVLIFLLVGILVTMIIQSSAATFAIVLIMCGKGWIPFQLGCAVVLGSNIGTTITPILASLSANGAAKKAAAGHFLFNFFGSIWTIILFFPFVHLNEIIMGWLGQDNPIEVAQQFGTESAQYADAVSIGLSMFHTIFNIVNLCVMIWFCELYVKITDFLIRTKPNEDETFQLQYISTNLMTAAELNISQAEHEIALYGERVNRMWGMVKEFIHIEPGTQEANKLFSRIEKYEEIADRMEVEIAKYLNKVSGGRLSYESKLRIAALLNIVTEIESIADCNCNIARTMIRKEEAKATFNDDIMKAIDTMSGYVSSALDNMVKMLHNIETVQDNDILVNINKETEINNYRNLLRRQNIEKINDGEYDYQSGIYFMDVVCEAEKLGDYIINVTDGIRAQKRHHETVVVAHEKL